MYKNSDHLDQQHTLNLMKIASILLMVLISLPLAAQKKVVPATSSVITGIRLPSGTLQDKRLFSVATADVFLETETKNFGVEVSSAEVFKLSPEAEFKTLNEEVIKSFIQSEWKIIPFTNNTEYSWLVKGSQYVIVYLSGNSKSRDMYFGLADGVPALATVAEKTNAGIPGTAQPAEVIEQPQASQPVNSFGGLSIKGTWLRTSSINPYNGGRNMDYGYTKRQYTFQEDGTYIFYAKTWDMSMENIILRKENGTYQLAGDKLIITPAQSIIETWSKKDGADAWGNKLKSEVLPFENSSYILILKNYGEGIGWNLIMTPESRKQTQRDGAYSVNSEFPNSYFYEIPRDSSYLIDLPVK
jgi:hypothetical protein